MIQAINFFKLNKTDSLRKKVNKTICNIQTPQVFVSRVFPRLPYCKENSEILKSFQFQYSDFRNFGYIQLCQLLVKNKNCYATHRKYVGKTFTSLQIRLKTKAKLITKRPSKNPFRK